MSGNERIDYIQAKRVLEDAGFAEKSLEDVAKDWVKFRNKVLSNATIEECYNQWIDSYVKKQENKTRSGQTGENNERAKKHLLPYFHLQIGEFLWPHVAEKFANEFEQKTFESLVTKKNDWAKCKQFFNWCRKPHVKHLPKNEPNPLDDLIEIETVNSPAPYIMTPDEIESVLNAAYQTDEKLNLLPFFILNLLCGIRPSEAQAITWDCIRIDDSKEPLVHIPERDTGKNKEPRTFDLIKFPNVVEWFKLCDRTRPLFPFPKQQKRDKVSKRYNKNRQLVFETAGIKLDRKYNDCGRHACATYMYKGIEGFTVSDITERLGHSGKMLMKHYKNGNVLKSDAERYFKIYPVKVRDKLVKFA